MTLRFRTVFWAVTGLVAAGLIIYAFLPRPIPVDLARVERGALEVTVRDEGRTRVRDVYTVSAPVSGRLLRVEVEAGDAVQAGDVIANLLPSDPAFLDARSQSEARAAARSAEAALGFARAELESAQAQLDYALSEDARVEQLFEREIASRGALDRARLELRTARAAVATARANVRMREAEREAAEARLMEPGDEAGDAAPTEGVVSVRAPIDGQVLRVIQESETVLNAGAAILELGDPSDLEVVVELLSSDAVRAGAGDGAIVDAWGGEPLRARVRRVEPFGFLKISALGVEEQRVNAILDLLDPPGDLARLGHGYRVEAEIMVERAEDVVAAPTASLFRTDDGWAVFAVENDRARARAVEIGRSNETRAEIISGLAAGETVVLYPAERIEDGVAVRAR